VTASLPDPTAENRLIYHVPPQEGKSEQVSRRFPAYALGRDPNLRVAATSYSATLDRPLDRTFLGLGMQVKPWGLKWTDISSFGIRWMHGIYGN
jgi:hypothetical protein